jgi:hypothetical protein
MRVTTGVASSYSAAGGSSNGTSGSQSALSKSIGVCAKCGCKRRHSRTCPYKKKGEDDDDIMVCYNDLICCFCSTTTTLVFLYNIMFVLCY